MKILAFFTLCVMMFLRTSFCFGQVYSLQPRLGDEFSKTLVTLLNSAPGRFSDLKDTFIHTTYLGENIYDLRVKLPGSKTSIVLLRDHSTNVYVEFQGYSNYDEVNEGIRELSGKIKKALGDQVYDRNMDTGQIWRRFTGYSIRDESGYYGMNFELFAGRTAFESYLLSPDKEPGNGTRHFILLKITGGTPSYYHFIKQREMPLRPLTVALQQVIAASKQDFSEFRKKGSEGRLKKNDTISLQGHQFLMRYRGSNYTATVKWENREGERERLHESIQGAVGPLYVYYAYKINGRKAYLYFDNSGDTSSPRIYLEEDEQGKYLLATIHSPVDHPTKRNWDPDD
jgi:hypothetical protein